MTLSNEIRRTSDGLIDFDFYRRQATTLRARAMRRKLRMLATRHFLLMTLSLMAGATASALTLHSFA